MLVTVSGLPGSGTSTAAKAVATRLDLAHVDGGKVFRSLASDTGVSLAELGRRAERDPSIDSTLDGRLAEYGRKGSVVLESRLAGWIAQNENLDATSVWLRCDPGERARRVANREGRTPGEARRLNEDREASEARRYREYYDIDIASMAPYSLVIDTFATGPLEVVELIVAAVLA